MRAPDFTVCVTSDRGLVCGDPMPLEGLALLRLRAYGAEARRTPVEGPWCRRVCAVHDSSHLPLVADVHPRAWIASAVGACGESEGIAERALVIVGRREAIA